MDEGCIRYTYVYSICIPKSAALHLLHYQHWFQKPVFFLGSGGGLLFVVTGVWLSFAFTVFSVFICSNLSLSDRPSFKDHEKLDILIVLGCVPISDFPPPDERGRSRSHCRWRPRAWASLLRAAARSQAVTVVSSQNHPCIHTCLSTQKQIASHPATSIV